MKVSYNIFLFLLHQRTIYDIIKFEKRGAAMRYFTKEFYDVTMQSSCLGCALNVDERAETFSNSFYKMLYKESKDEFIAHIKTIYKDLDSVELGKRFDALCRSSKKKFERLLPKDIIEKVTDIRVLALKCCSASVKSLIEDYSKKQDDVVTKTFEDYKANMEKQFNNDFPDWLDKFWFHDFTVLSARKLHTNYVINFDIDETDDWSVRKITLKNAKIIKKEGRISGYDWKYDEIYKTDEGYEIHVLLHGKKLSELIISCDDVILDKKHN